MKEMSCFKMWCPERQISYHDTLSFLCHVIRYRGKLKFSLLAPLTFIGVIGKEFLWISAPVPHSLKSSAEGNQSFTGSILAWDHNYF